MRPFSINVPEVVLTDLQHRLANTRWPDEIDGAGWDYGTNREYLRQLTDYWQHGYDWRVQEAWLNGFPQFKAEIDGLELHFIRIEGKGPDPLPLLLVHGWPDSFWRMLKMLPLLTDPAGHAGHAPDAFTVVVPSIPGYGFSDKPTEKGMTPEHIAGLFNKLMTEVLGYERYGAHGGDWGSNIVEQLALHHAGYLTGIHLTDVPSIHEMTASKQQDLSAREGAYVAEVKAWQMKEGAYSQEQGTKPQTLSYGLNDSPVGLLAWITEKFYAWSDHGGNLDDAYSKDELLTNVMIYWVTQSIGSSVRLYYETMRTLASLKPTYVKVPTGFTIFPKDIVPAPRPFAERFFNVRRWEEMPRGGHFAAVEEPGLLVRELREFFALLRSPTTQEPGA